MTLPVLRKRRAVSRAMRPRFPRAVISATLGRYELFLTLPRLRFSYLWVAPHKPTAEVQHYVCDGSVYAVKTYEALRVFPRPLWRFRRAPRTLELSVLGLSIEILW
jgi:hypothetical protein